MNVYPTLKEVKCVTGTASYQMMAAPSQSQLLERLNVWKLQYLVRQEPFNSWSWKALTGAPLCWCLLVKSCLLRSQSPGVKVHEVMFAVEVGGCGVGGGVGLEETTGRTSFLFVCITR